MNHVNMRLLGLDGPRYYHDWPSRLTDALVWKGQAGVQIFFAVSGFLITSTAIRRWGNLSQLRLRDFYLIRFARIAPLLLALLAILSLLHALRVPNFIVAQKTGGLAGALFAALTFHIGLLEATKGYLPGNWDILWSLGVEEVFYLGFPLACRFLRGGKWLVLFLLIFVVLGPFGRTILTQGNPVWQEYSYLGGMDAIALGCLTAILLSRVRLSRLTVRVAMVTGLLILIFCLCFSSEVAKMGLESNGLSFSLIAIGSCLLIASAAQSQLRFPGLFKPGLLYGRRSYEIYLTHMFVVYALFDWFQRSGHPLRLIPLLFAGSILLAGLLGELVARLYSEPANLWLRKKFGDGPQKLGSVLDAQRGSPPAENIYTR